MSFVTLKNVLHGTKEGKYCVGAFNFNGYEDAQGIVNAASKLNSPVILMASMSAVEYIGLKQCVGMIRGMAESVDIPVCLHLDHSKSIELCKEAVIAGFGSVMIDASADDYNENVRKTREVVEFAHRFGTSVEAEIGHVAGVEDNIAVSERDALLTQPTEAARFAVDTGIDAMAVAIGTAHGFYKAKPKIDFDRLKKIRELTDVYLVLHGGTGVPDEDFTKCIALGMNKINVGTQLKKAYSDTLREKCAELGTDVIDPRKFTSSVKDNVGTVVTEKINIFGSVNKA